MISSDMLLTTILVIGCMSVLAESIVRCNPGDKKTTITVEADFQQRPLKTSSSNVKEISSSKTFQSYSNAYARAQESLDSMDTSVSASGSYGSFSASVSAAYSSVTQSASSMSAGSSGETSGETYSETETTESREYFEGQSQIMRDIKTTVTIDGTTSVMEEKEIFTARSVDNPMTPPELRQLARDYISNKYGDVTQGTISGGGTIFTQSQCYKPPKTGPWSTRDYIAADLEKEPLYIKTDSGLGTGDKFVIVNWYNQQGEEAGGIQLTFSNTLRYLLRGCSSNLTPFPVTLPSQQEKVWKITKLAGPRVVITCNGQQVLNLQLSSVCSQHGWGREWSRYVTKMKFSPLDSATKSYCLGIDCRN